VVFLIASPFVLGDSFRVANAAAPGHSYLSLPQSSSRRFLAGTAWFSQLRNVVKLDSHQRSQQDEIMHSINRAAIVVRPKPPFFDWARSLEGGLPKSTEAWTSVYLMPASEGDQPEEIMRQCFEEIFEEQLEGWHRDADAWPTPRTFSLFQDWFDVEVVDLVFDISEEPIEPDD
jgi:hypothetical protein